MSKTLDLLNPINWDHPLNRGLVFWLIPHPYFIRGCGLANAVDPSMVLASFMESSPLLISPRANRIHSSFLLFESQLNSAFSLWSKRLQNIRFASGTGLTLFLSMEPTVETLLADYVFSVSAESNELSLELEANSTNYFGGVRALMYINSSNYFRTDSSSPLSPYFDTLAVVHRNGFQNDARFYENGAEKSGAYWYGNGNTLITGEAQHVGVNLFVKSGIQDIRLNAAYLDKIEIAALHEENMKGYPNLLRWLTGRAYFLPLEEYGSGLLLAGKRNSLISPSIVV